MQAESKHKNVSIAVITYNSEMYVFESLESVKAQSYQDIDLIISDDSSQDNTLEVVQDWTSRYENKRRFKSIKIITVSKNTGLPANCNRALKAAKTKWVKFLAGDDILLPNCLEENMQYIQSHPKVKVLFSQVMVYRNSFEEKDFYRKVPDEFPNNLMHPDYTANDQYKLLLYSDRITYTPSFFFNRLTINDLGGFDETIRLVEDYPMWLKLTQNGIKLNYFHIPTVGYRIHPEAINNTGESVLFKPSVIYSYKIRKKYAFPHLPWVVRASESWQYWVSIIFLRIGWTKKSVIVHGMYLFFTVYLNPFIYLQSFQKRIFKR